MHATLLSLALLCAAAPPVEKTAAPETLLYVRTTPAGAEIRLGGKPLGTSDGLFPVKAGSYRIVLDLQDHQPLQQQITVQHGRITRVECQLETQPAAATAPSQATPEKPLRRSVCIVVGEGRMTFEGQDTTWEELPKLLQKVPHRKHTVLGLATTTEDMPLKEYNRAAHRAAAVVRQFGFEYLSHIGVHPLGFRGTPAPAESEGPSQPAAQHQPPPEASKALCFGPVVEQVLRDPEKRVAELLDLDTGQRATMKEFGKNDRQTHRWIREHAMDLGGFVEAGGVGVFFFDAAVFDSSEISWETITPREVNEDWHLNQNEPKPIIPLATDKPDKLPMTCLFETREGTKGVLQLLGATDDDKSARVRYKLLRPAAPQTQPDAEGARPRHFVRLVVGEDGTTMTFEGKKTTWEELSELLEEVADRKHTVLELARPSDQITIQQQNNARFRAGRLAQRLGFEYLSIIGVHPLGSKGSPTQILPAKPKSRF